MSAIHSICRYSSSNQTGGVSLDLQRDAIRQFIKHQPELRDSELVERVDEAKTGTTFLGRFGFESILNSARSGDYLVVYKYDRLGRNLLESLQTLQRLENDLNIEKIEVSSDLTAKIYVAPEGLLADIPEMALADEIPQQVIEGTAEAELRVSCTYPRRDSNPRPPV